MRQRSFILAVATGLMASCFGAARARAGGVLAGNVEDNVNIILKAEGTGKIAITVLDGSLTQTTSGPIAARPVVLQLPGPEGLIVNSSDTVTRWTSYSFTATSRAERTSASVSGPSRLQYFCIAALAVWILIHV
jgi:hypothetical protein